MRPSMPMPGRLRWTVAAVACGVFPAIVSGCSGSDRQSEVPLLWKPVDVASTLPASPQVINSQTVEVEVERLRPPGNKRLEILLPDGSRVTAVVTGYEAITPQQFIWRGKIAGAEGGVVTLSVLGSTIVGDILTARGKMYTIRLVRDGIALIEQLDPRGFPRDQVSQVEEARVLPGHPEALGVDRGTVVVPVDLGRNLERIEAPGRALLTDEAPTIDVMFLYTQKAAQYAGGAEAVGAKIEQMISDAETSFVASKVNQHVRSVHVEPTDYTEKNDLFLDWKALKGSSNTAQMTGVSDMRRNFHADIVIMLTEPATTANSSACGQASQMHEVATSFCSSAYAVIPINCATSTYSFVHELGHLMGADHNDEAGTFGAPFEHSHGFIAASHAWHTVMAYPGGECVTPECQRVLLWSNPDVNYAEGDSSQDAPQPESAGSATANNALSLNKTATTVAAFSDECN